MGRWEDKMFIKDNDKEERRGCCCCCWWWNGYCILCSVLLLLLRYFVVLRDEWSSTRVIFDVSSWRKREMFVIQAIYPKYLIPTPPPPLFIHQVSSPGWLPIFHFHPWFPYLFISFATIGEGKETDVDCIAYLIFCCCEMKSVMISELKEVSQKETFRSWDKNMKGIRIGIRFMKWSEGWVAGAMQGSTSVFVVVRTLCNLRQGIHSTKYQQYHRNQLFGTYMKSEMMKLYV